MGKLRARHVRRLRKYIENNRCTKRPGLTHHWEIDYTIVDYMQACPPAEEILVCSKCGKEEY